MAYTAFSPLSVSDLTNKSIFALSKSVSSLFSPLRSTLSPVLMALLDELDLNTQQMGLHMNKNQKGRFTQPLRVLDKDRDALLGEIFRVSSSFLRSSSDDKKQAATELQYFLSPYRGIAYLPANDETAAVEEMMMKFNADPALVTAANVLDLGRVFSAVAAKNTEYKTQYNAQKDDKVANRGSASNYRPMTITSFVQLCTALEQAYNYAPDDNITVLFNKVDEYRKTYHALIGTDDDDDETTTTTDTASNA